MKTMPNHGCFKVVMWTWSYSKHKRKKMKLVRCTTALSLGKLDRKWSTNI